MNWRWKEGLEPMFYELAEKALALERAGRKIIRLNIGDTNLPAPPEAVEAARQAMDGATGYGSSAGGMELRKLAAEREGCEVENIVVGPGSKHLIYGLMSVLGKRGAKVSVPVPHWPMYGLACRQLGLEFLPVKAEVEKNWQFDGIGADLAIICNPNNPTSTVYTGRSIESAVQQSKFAILDEAYRDLAFEKIPNYEGAIRIRSFSKEFNMENWRLGYAVAPKEVAKKLIAYNQITSTCVPPFVQAAGIACLQNREKIVAGNRKIWKGRMDAAVSAMKKAGFEFAEPQSAMYVFATHSKISDAGEFAMRLLEKGVAVAPGGDFGEKRFFRIACNQEQNVMREAVEKMASVLNK